MSMWGKDSLQSYQWSTRENSSSSIFGSPSGFSEPDLLSSAWHRLRVEPLRHVEAMLAEPEVENE
jgi:hypothetical protein